MIGPSSTSSSPPAHIELHLPAALSTGLRLTASEIEQIDEQARLDISSRRKATKIITHFLCRDRDRLRVEVRVAAMVRIEVCNIVRYASGYGFHSSPKRNPPPNSLQLSSRRLQPSELPQLPSPEPSPDHTPPGASAFSPAASRIAREQMAADIEARACDGVGELFAVSEDDSEVRCAVEVVAPCHKVSVIKQDFFARFKI